MIVSLSLVSYCVMIICLMTFVWGPEADKGYAGPTTDPRFAFELNRMAATSNINHAYTYEMFLKKNWPEHQKRIAKWRKLQSK